jgi:hypothetical protein
MLWSILIIKGLGTCKYSQDATVMGLDTIHDPKAKNDGVAPRQILNIQLFQQFPLIEDDFEH